MMASARTSAPSLASQSFLRYCVQKIVEAMPYRTSIAPVSCCRTPHRAHPAVTRPAPARSRRPASARAFARRPPPRFRAPLAPATTSPTLCLDIPWDLAISFWDIPASRSRGTSFTLIFIAMYRLLLLGRRLTVLVAGTVSYGASPPPSPSPNIPQKAR